MTATGQDLFPPLFHMIRFPADASSRPTNQCSFNHKTRDFRFPQKSLVLSHHKLVCIIRDDAFLIRFDDKDLHP